MWALLIGELRSMPRLMSWTPWQSLHEGATTSPISRTACPWMLSRYWLATSGYFIRYSSVMPSLAWHLAQVRERLSLKVGEFGLLELSMSCLPWQSVQLAAADSPRVRLTPWMLLA